MLRVFERRGQGAVCIGPHRVRSNLAVLHFEQVIHVPKPKHLLIVIRVGCAIAAAFIAVALRAFVAHAAFMSAGKSERGIRARARHDHAESCARKMRPQIIRARNVFEIGMQRMIEAEVEQRACGYCVGAVEIARVERECGRPDTEATDNRLTARLAGEMRAAEQTRHASGIGESQPEV